MNSTNGNGTSAKFPFDAGMCERYLLGELSSTEQDLFETAYFNDDAFLNRFLAVKDELLDLYSRDELDPEKRLRVERHFGSTGPRQQRLTESRDFIRSVTVIADRNDVVSLPTQSQVEPKRSAFFGSFESLFRLPTLAAFAGLLILIAAGFWILNRSESTDLVAEEPAQPLSNTVPSNPDSASESVPPVNDTKATTDPRVEPTQRPNGDQAPDIAVNPNPDVRPGTSPPAPSQSIDPALVPQLPAATPEQRVAEVAKPPEPKPEVSGARTETVTLSSTSRSITGRNTASISSATQNVVIRMLFSGGTYDTYSVRVTTLGGATVWRAANLTIGSARSLAVTVPAGSLTRKDYIVVLEGRSAGGASETIREYYLHVDRQ